MSSISVAIARMRPDLNRRTRFQRAAERWGPKQWEPTLLSDIDVNPAYRPSASSAPGDEPASAPTAPSPKRRFPWRRLIAGRGKWRTGLTRARILGVALAATCLGIVIGFFPRLEQVNARAKALTPDRAETTRSQAASPEASSTIMVATSQEPRATGAKAARKTLPVERHVLVPVLAKSKSATKVAAASATVTAPAKAKASATVAAPVVTTVAAASSASVSVAKPQAIAPQAVAPASVIDGASVALAPIAPQPAPRATEVLYEALPTPPPPAATAEAPASASGRQVARASASRAASLQEIKLSGIFWDKTRPMAMINGDIVEVGQAVGSARVVEINPQSIVVEENGQRRELGL
jgi:hypothetical protein